MAQQYRLGDLQERYLQHHRARGSSPNTIARYEQSFAMFDRFLGKRTRDSRVLTTEVMHEYAIWLRDTPVKQQRGRTSRSEAGIHAHLRDLRAWMRWLSAEGILELNIKVPLPQLPNHLFPILTDEEMERVWTSKYLTGKSGLAIRNRALLGLMLDTGLRRSEVANLNVEDIELHNQMVTVTGKGNKQRRVSYSNAVQVLLTEWLRFRGMEEGSVFGLSSHSVRTVFRRIGEDVGLERFHPHLYRHQAATMMVRANMDLATVKRILGHSDIATTLKYLSLSDDDVRVKHQAASPFEKLATKIGTVERPKRLRLRLDTAS